MHAGCDRHEASTYAAIQLETDKSTDVGSDGRDNIKSGNCWGTIHERRYVRMYVCMQATISVV